MINDAFIHIQLLPEYALLSVQFSLPIPLCCLQHKKGDTFGKKRRRKKNYKLDDHARWNWIKINVIFLCERLLRQKSSLLMCKSTCSWFNFLRWVIAFLHHGSLPLLTQRVKRLKGKDEKPYKHDSAYKSFKQSEIDKS